MHTDTRKGKKEFESVHCIQDKQKEWERGKQINMISTNRRIRCKYGITKRGSEQENTQMVVDSYYSYIRLCTYV